MLDFVVEGHICIMSYENNVSTKLCEMLVFQTRYYDLNPMYLHNAFKFYIHENINLNETIIILYNKSIYFTSPLQKI